MNNNVFEDFIKTYRDAHELSDQMGISIIDAHSLLQTSASNLRAGMLSKRHDRPTRTYYHADIGTGRSEGIIAAYLAKQEHPYSGLLVSLEGRPIPTMRYNVKSRTHTLSHAFKKSIDKIIEGQKKQSCVSKTISERICNYFMEDTKQYLNILTEKWTLIKKIFEQGGHALILKQSKPYNLRKITNVEDALIFLINNRPMLLINKDGYLIDFDSKDVTKTKIEWND